MKRALLLFSFLLGLLSFNGNAQNVSLRIDSIIGIPDTVFPGQIVSYSVILSNNGFIPYQGPLQLAMDNGQGQIAYLYFSATPVVVLPGSTYTITGSTVTIDSSFFRPGGNVVVVWPYTSQLIAYTPKVFNTYVTNSFQGIAEPSLAETVRIYPNPASSIVHISNGNYTIERVRIFDIKGRIMFNENYDQKSLVELNIDHWPVGLYSIELFARDEKITKQLLKNRAE
jgi:hypothetical protein